MGRVFLNNYVLRSILKRTDELKILINPSNMAVIISVIFRFPHLITFKRFNANE